MNTEQAERILKLFADSLEQGKGFVLDQAPEVAQQVILWKRTESVVTVVALLLVSLCCTLAARKLLRGFRKATKEPGDEEILWFFGSLVSIITAVACCASAVLNAILALQVWLAPKAFLLEYAADLLKG